MIKAKTCLSFTLDCINIAQVNAKYNINKKEESKIEDNPSGTTKLTDLNQTEKGAPEIISYLDESKRSHTCQISMIDFVNKTNINKTKYHCFWCRNSFKNQPIGCPLKYVPSQLTKTYHSYISKDTYTIKENITTSTRQKDLDLDKFTVHKGEYYETTGSFCSFNCCQAFIDDNKHNRLYDNSTMLLTKMFNDAMNSKNQTINPAPNWKLLDTYGGYLTIQQFRDSFNKIDYDFQGYTNPLPQFLSTGVLYEEKIKF